jgi:hypothetical protein
MIFSANLFMSTEHYFCSLLIQKLQRRAEFLIC